MHCIISSRTNVQNMFYGKGELMKSKKNNIRTAICVLSVFVALIAALIYIDSNKKKDFEYASHLGERVLTVNSVKNESDSIDINLQEMAFYIINVEGDVHQMAIQYNSKNPRSYWNIKLDKMYTMRDYAKDLSFDSCVRDNIYYLEAVKNQVTLTKEEEELALNDAYLIMKNLNGKQMDVANFSVEVVYSIEKKLYIASKYVNELVKNGHTKEELELKGTYYTNIKDNYLTDTNEEIWNQVRLGNLTVE